MYIGDGGNVIFGGLARVSGAEGSKVKKDVKMTREVLVALAEIVDEALSKGKAPTSNMIVVYVQDKHRIRIHQIIAGRGKCKLCLWWAPLQAARRACVSYCAKVIRDYLVTLDKYVKLIKTEGSNKVFVFMDKSYVDIHHTQKKGFVLKDEKVDPLVSRKSVDGEKIDNLTYTW